MTEAASNLSLERSLERLAERLQQGRSARTGDIVFVTTGREAGEYAVEVGPAAARVTSSATPGAARERRPLIEVRGDVETLRAILDGERDAREQFLQGGLRVRGDLRYLSDVAMDLGILTAPL